MINTAYQQAHFVTSAAKLTQLLPDQGIEVAFAGRSNAGKSSALNTITQQKKLAHTSKTPGRTQLINYFKLDDERHLVDLPGYGYAKVAMAIKERWQRTLAEYLETRDSLRGLVLVMDIRHPLREMDTTMIQWGVDSDLPVHILLSKADKLSRSQAKQTLLFVCNAVKPYQNLVSVQTFSSLNRSGLEEVHAKLDEWFEYPPQ